uniref:Uncharacterized protein n=1 Tax=Ceratitis capitata TaxID=7213 RepID=W8B026_CERCA
MCSLSNFSDDVIQSKLRLAHINLLYVQLIKTTQNKNNNNNNNININNSSPSEINPIPIEPKVNFQAAQKHIETSQEGQESREAAKEFLRNFQLRPANINRALFTVGILL